MDDLLLSELLQHSFEWKQNNEEDKWPQKAIRMLFKKLQLPEVALAELKEILKYPKSRPGACITVVTSKDNRVQVANRKSFPHVISCRIWRWPDLQNKTELMSIGKCQYAFRLQKNSTDLCINPYHYYRVEPQGLFPPVMIMNSPTPIKNHDLPVKYVPAEEDQSPSASPRPSNTTAGRDQSVLPLKSSPGGMLQKEVAPSNSEWESRWLLPTDLPPIQVPQFRRNPPVHSLQAAGAVLEACVPASGGSGVNYTEGSFSLLKRAANISGGVLHDFEEVPCTVNYTVRKHTILYKPMESAPDLDNWPLIPGEPRKAVHCESQALPTASSQTPNQTLMTGSPSNFSHNFVGNTAAQNRSEKLQPFPLVGYWPRYNNGTGFPPYAPQPAAAGGGMSYSGSVQPLSYTPVHYRDPKHWCSITYYELNDKIGETFPGRSAGVFVDGYTSPNTSFNRFSLGSLTNASRNPVGEETLRHIGKGVQLTYSGGNVFAKCLSNNSLFVEIPNCDRDVGLFSHKATVCEIKPGHASLIFDVQLFMELLSNASSRDFQAVLDLTRACMIRASFVKGWGSQYQRQFIYSTPCWVEIQLHGPLLWVQGVLNEMELPHYDTDSDAADSDCDPAEMVPVPAEIDSVPIENNADPVETDSNPAEMVCDPVENDSDESSCQGF